MKLRNPFRKRWALIHRATRIPDDTLKTFWTERGAREYRMELKLRARHVDCEEMGRLVVEPLP